MCEANGKLIITYQDSRGYIKGRIGPKGFYIPAKGGSRMAQIARANEGQIVNASTMRGMLVKVEVNNERFREISNNKERIQSGDSLESNLDERASKEAQQRDEISHRANNDSSGGVSKEIKFWTVGVYAYVCRACGARIFAASLPKVCPHCGNK